MDKEEKLRFFMEQIPALSRWQTAVPTYVSQLILFVFVMLFFYWISQLVFYGAIIGQGIVSIILSIHYILLAKNSKKIRTDYLDKYKEFASQKFWYHYQFWAIPLISAAFYFPLLLKTDYLLPSIISLPSHFLTSSILPWFLALFFGFLMIVLGVLLDKKPAGYSIAIDHYLDIIHPEKIRLVSNGVYSFIRNPQYLSRGLISIGFGFLANNLVAIFVGIIHFVSYAVIIPSEDRYILSRFGKDFEEYKRRAPALIPRIKKR